LRDDDDDDDDDGEAKGSRIGFEAQDFGSIDLMNLSSA